MARRDLVERRGTAVAHNLPAAVSSFLGRDAELAELWQLLQEERLVTLTGAPGMGKSRLAVELAATLLDAYRDGAWLVELAPVSDEAHVADSGWIDVPFARQHFRRQSNCFSEVASDLGERRQKQVAEAMTAEFSFSAKPIAK